MPPATDGERREAQQAAGSPRKRGDSSVVGVAPYGAAGFTLLEVLIAVAILSLSLTSLISSQMASIRSTAYARELSVVVLLLIRLTFLLLCFAACYSVNLRVLEFLNS